MRSGYRNLMEVPLALSANWPVEFFGDGMSQQLFFRGRAENHSDRIVKTMSFQTEGDGECNSEVSLTKTFSAAAV